MIKLKLQKLGVIRNFSPDLVQVGFFSNAGGRVRLVIVFYLQYVKVQKRVINQVFIIDSIVMRISRQKKERLSGSKTKWCNVTKMEEQTIPKIFVAKQFCNEAKITEIM